MHQLRRNAALFMFGLFFVYGQIFAQEYTSHIRKFGIEDGLSSYNVTCSLQDHRGFWWFGTDYGLNRFDGRDFKVFTKEEYGLCGNSILEMLEDQAGMLWLKIGTRGDFQNHYCIFDPIKEQTQSIDAYLGEAPPFDPKLTSINGEPFGKITFLELPKANSGANGVLKFYELSGKKIKHLFQLAAEDKLIKGMSLTGLYAGKNNEFALYQTDRSTGKIEVVYFDAIGNFLRKWACPAEFLNQVSFRSENGSLCAYCAVNLEDKWHVKFFIDGKTAQKEAFLVKPNWEERFSYQKGKIVAVTGDSMRIFDSTATLIHQSYTGLGLKAMYHSLPLVDDDFNVWIVDGEFLIAISLRPKIFKKALNDAELPRRMRGIVAGQNHEIYATEYWASWKNETNDTWDSFLYGSKLHLGLALQDSILWMGLEGYALGKYNLKTGHYDELLLQSNGQNSIANMVWMPHVRKDGSVWAGTNRGIYKLDSKKAVLMPFAQNEDSLFGNSIVYAFHENEAGTWLCSSNGLFLVDLDAEKVLAHYGANEKGEFFLPADHIAHFHEDKKGVFWLATKGTGLVKWNPKTKASKIYSPQSAGLSHNVLYAVYGDDFDNLWISSSYGLMRFNKSDEFVQTFRVEDGLPNNEFNTISHFQAADGELYFGGQNGFIHFHPKDFQANEVEAPLLITDCYLQDRATDSLSNWTLQLLESHSLNIRPSTKALILNIALLDYHDAQHHQYGYFLEGYDRDWVFMEGSELKLNNLPYGAYKLKLRAKSANGSRWVEYAKPISVHVLKPIYLQTWFILLAITLLIAIIYLGFRARIRGLEARKRELELQVEERTKTIEADKIQIQLQAEELKALDKLKSQFFANISHELRTPLTLILGPLSYILDNPAEMEKEAIRKQLLVMQRNGKSLLQLVEEVLDLSRMDAKKMELIEEETPIRLFFEQVLSTFEHQFRNQGIHLETRFRLQAEQDLSVMLDRKKMEKVLNNFLSNALKFTPRGGKISFYLEDLGEELKIKVQDNGKGISPTDLPHVFERYFQTKLIQEKSYSGGTGIGLALVHDFSLLMGGRSYVESELGKGATFFFEWEKKETVARKKWEQPIAEKEEADDTLIDNVGKDFRVLVVEDNADMRAYISALLEGHFKEVVQAENGAIALEILNDQNKEIQLIISDIMMPEIDGLSLLKLVKAHDVWHQIPMIMLTALVEDRDKLEALTLGVDDYLTKPFSSAELLVRAKNLLYNYQQRRLWQVEEEGEPAEKVANEKPQEAAIDSREFAIQPMRESDKAELENFRLYVLSTIPDQIPDVNSFADKFAVSPRQLTRQIKRITGLTPARFVREVQLQVARGQLESGTAISVKEVSYNAGFEQPSTFSALFKKRFGIPPSDYLSVSEALEEG